jgi:hypothetical protein
MKPKIIAHKCVMRVGYITTQQAFVGNAISPPKISASSKDGFTSISYLIGKCDMFRKNGKPDCPGWAK